MAEAAAALAPWLQRQRQQLLAQRGHAWLLHGPSGLGQYTLALELARAWLCESPTPAGACGQCASCHGIAVRTHADLRVLMPEVQMQELGWPLPEKAQAELDEKKRKPSREIRVDALRDAVEFAQRTSARGRGKVVLIYPAEQMNAISANALLKTLEEPPGEVRFVLASEAAHQLLPTIRSRCQAHALHWPAPQEALDWLHQQGVAPQAAEVWLRAAGARPDDALALARSGRSPEAWARIPRALAAGDHAALAELTPPQLVTVLQKLCHDLLVLGVGGAPRYFAAADLPAPAQLPSLAVLTRWGALLRQEARSAEHPYNAGLMLQALVAQAREALALNLPHPHRR
ncbi:DNA polymerase III subunit delta' [Comamonas sp. NLF-1-9]|uniref:DNA polymerase III subunit delta' n=1 Tax=Comamonas sp. NLF-1-9 TaxID=2853163 RepID=UPI001C43E378|nr:DNA polymerase III subunit delta' [Comamonas sp. NLF-1-9]QXL83165.1 DNA polymerase III subunit delta' [Comamonas sp. NLF-1-9]